LKFSSTASLSVVAALCGRTGSLALCPEVPAAQTVRGEVISPLVTEAVEAAFPCLTMHPKIVDNPAIRLRAADEETIA
jgi:hypothetical protein